MADTQERLGSARPTLLRWLWSGQWRAGPGRAAAAVAAIAIGVALGLGIHLVNRSALEEFDAALAVINSEAQASLIATSGSFAEAVYPIVATDPAIAAASPVVQTEVRVLAVVRAGESSRPENPASERLPVIGLDVMRAAQVAPALLPAAEGGAAGAGSEVFADDAIFLSAAAQRALGAAPGDTLRVQAGALEARLRVAGGVPGAGAGQALAVMDIGAAQWRLGWLGRLSRIDLKLAAGVDARRMPASLTAALPDGLGWSTPDASRRRMSNLSRAYRVNLSVLALVALFTGGFIVYATLALAVLRQQGELALLGVLGASRRFLVLNVLGQAAVLGAFGAVLGVTAGIGLAAVTLRLVGGDLGGGYFTGSIPALAIDAVSVVGFALLGVASGIAGGLAPALSIFRMTPARALRGGDAEPGLAGSAPARGRLPPGALPGAALALTGAGLLAAPPVEGLPLAAYAAIAAWLLAGILFVPTVTRQLGRWLGSPWLGSWQAPTVWLAIQRMQGAPGRAAAALAGVVASVALATAMALMVHSFRVSVDRWLDTVLPADLYGRTQDGAQAGALDDAAQAAIRAVAGVARAEFLRAIDLQLDPARPPVTLLARDLSDVEIDARLPLVGRRASPPPGAVPIHVSEAVVDLYGFSVGDTVALPLALRADVASPRFFVASVWRDYARQHGTIVIDAAELARLTGDRSASDVALWLAPGASSAAVLDGIERTVPALRGAGFRSATEIRALSLSIFDRSFAVTYVLEAIAILVGLFGVAATYAGEAFARTREFGMLRHFGLTRWQVARTFSIEAGTLLLTGVVWGGMIGVAIALVLVRRVNPQSFHWSMELAWPWGLLATCAAALVGSGILVAALASRSATSADPVRAVRNDW